MITQLIAKKNIILNILILALPAIIEMSLNTAVGIADSLMISRMVGSEALAGVGFANSIFFPLIFVFSSFNTGATALISRSFGKKDYSMMNKIGSQTLLLNTIIGIFIMVFALTFSKQIFLIYDTTESVSEVIQIYFPIVAYGLPALFLALSFAAILRGAGDTMSPMIITGIANIVNVIGNYVLIKGVWIFPKMEVAGAALATTISRVVAVIIYVAICFLYHNRIRLKFTYMKIEKTILKPLFSISSSSGMEQAIMQSAIIVLSIIVSQMDTVSETVYRILLNIESLSFMPAVGISIAAATLVGKSLGEDDIKKAFEVGTISYSIAICWGIILGSIFFIFKYPLLAAFTKDVVVIQAGLITMNLIAINQPLLNFIITISGALRGAGDTKSVMIIAIMRYWLIFVPFSYIFSILLNFGIAGIWSAEILSYTIFNAFLYRRFSSKKWANLNFTIN